MGDDIICWKTNIFEKQPGEAGTGWHQVEAFTVFESATVAYPSLRYTEETTMATQELTVWTAFSPADKEHGCLRFLPGSHKQWYYDETKPMSRHVESKSHDFFGYDYSELKLDKDWDPNDQQDRRHGDEGGPVRHLPGQVHPRLAARTQRHQAPGLRLPLRLAFGEGLRAHRQPQWVRRHDQPRLPRQRSGLRRGPLRPQPDPRRRTSTASRSRRSTTDGR